MPTTWPRAICVSQSSMLLVARVDVGAEPAGHRSGVVVPVRVSIATV
jgi:hypothetical protein